VSDDLADVSGNIVHHLDPQWQIAYGHHQPSKPFFLPQYFHTLVHVCLKRFDDFLCPDAEAIVVIDEKVEIVRKAVMQVSTGERGPPAVK